MKICIDSIAIMRIGMSLDIVALVILRLSPIHFRAAAIDYKYVQNLVTTQIFLLYRPQSIPKRPSDLFPAKIGQAIYTLSRSTLAQRQYGYHRSSRTPCLQLKKKEVRKS